MARTLLTFAASLCVLVSIIQRTYCFNFETRLPVYKQGPGGESEASYFGFSVAEHVIRKVTTQNPLESPFDDSVIIVGAPIHQTSIDAEKPGGVFRCPFTTNPSDCTLIELDTELDQGGNGVANRSNQWLGVSVASQGPGGAVAACAHRYKFNPSTTNEIQGLGKCYFLNADLTKDPFSRDGDVPCRDITRPDNYNGNLYNYCQAGTDLALSRVYMYGDPDNVFSEYVMGIPGADNWLGGIATANTPSSTPPRSLITPLDYENNGVSFNSYLGFSVASAKLTDDDPNYTQWYIAGAPRSEAMGAILILKSTSGKAPYDVFRINAEKPSSSFGYDVAAADLNGDGYDDLIVGAPQYFDRNEREKAGAGGRVYIYLNKAHDGTFEGVEPIKLTGPRDSLFGQCVTNLRDINLDTYEDIAIGAPYENDGEGAVYVYLGNGAKGIVQPEAQKIRPSDLPMGLSGYRFPNASFGYAISGGVDLDGNGFPDMTVGAYEVEQIAILRGRPVITLETFTTQSLETLDDNITNCEYSGQAAICFSVEFCVSYFCNSELFDEPVTLQFDMEAETVRRELNLHPRVVFRDSGTYKLEAQTVDLLPQSEAEETCQEYEVIVKPGLKDIFRNIPIKLNFSLPETEAVMPTPGDPIPSLAPFPILNENVNPILTWTVSFEKECAKDDGKCITDLVVQSSVSLTGTPPVLKVGEQDEIVMSVSLDNRNEDAYDASLVITFPNHLVFIQIEDATPRIYQCPIEVGENETTISCYLGNPYPAGAHDSFRVRFDAAAVPPDAVEFNITIVASSTNDGEINPLDNEQVISIEVESITDILINGDGREQEYFSGLVRGESDMVYFEDIGVAVNQEWTIYNEGPGAVNTAMVTINFPYEVESGKWLLYMTEMPYVENDKGVCNVTPAIYVNELQLRPRNPEVAYSPVPAAAPTAPASTVAPASTQTGSSRKRREATAEEYTSPKELNAGKDITLDCESGSARCLTINCDIDPLTSKQEVKIIIRSRLWNSTFLEDYINSKSVTILTAGSVEIESAPYITQTNADNDRYKLSMKVTPDIKTLPPSKPLQWWIIALAVIGGLILLILLIILLWKCGFFERKTGYKYATVTQQQASGKGQKEKTAYYDDMYYASS